jgi:type II secretory pathway pseudopilin PulG
MIRRSARGRSGITLTEILISILIMGIGVISLATLFPIGMVKLRKAQQYTRSYYLFESAAADLGARNLLSASSFRYSPFYQASGPASLGPGLPVGFYDPFIQDTPSFGAPWGTLSPLTLTGVYRGYGGFDSTLNQGPMDSLGFRVPGTGLPVAYDPMWRAFTINPATGTQGVLPNTSPEARFGSGLGFLRADPAGGLPSAHGLQRLSNLSNFSLSFVVQTFVSPEDVVVQESSGAYPPDPSQPAVGGQILAPSTIVPDMTGQLLGNPVVTNDYRFSWFWTGQRSDSLNATIFDGSIVVCENRQFGMDLLPPVPGYPTPAAGNVPVPTGETTVEAIWGYSGSPDPTTLVGALGYGSRSAMRSVVLRWPTSLPDPDVRVGGWICDTTYERNQATSVTRYPQTGTGSLYSGQRCFWYQVAKKSDIVPDPGLTGDVGAYRRMTVTFSTPLQARSLLNFSPAGSTPVHVEAALIMPSVVTVIPRTIISRAATSP